MWHITPCDTLSLLTRCKEIEFTLMLQVQIWCFNKSGQFHIYDLFIFYLCLQQVNLKLPKEIFGTSRVVCWCFIAASMEFWIYNIKTKIQAPDITSPEYFWLFSSQNCKQKFWITAPPTIQMLNFLHQNNFLYPYFLDWKQN